MNLFQPNFDLHSGVAFLTKRVVGHFTTFTVGEGPLEPSEVEFGISRIAERRLQVTIFQLLGSLVENCHGCIGKGEGRAQVLHGGRKVPVARQGREESRAVRQTCAFAMLQFFFVLFITLLPAIAATHPVPLDKNTDAAKCLECHADKSKGKAVHSAMATGCLSCHEIRVNKDVTRVKLITATPSALCLTCHADKNAADIKGVVHKPAVRDCIKC